MGIISGLYVKRHFLLRTALFLILISGFGMMLTEKPMAADYAPVMVFGSYGSSNGQFQYPYTVAVDSYSNIYVGDMDKYNIQKFNSSGTYVSQFGSYGSNNGQFDIPNGIAIDSSGNIFVVDSFNSRVQKFNSAGIYQSQFGTYGAGNGQLNYPFDIAIDSFGNIFIADKGNNRIQKFNSAGIYQSQFGSYGTGNGQFNTPTGIAIDSSGNIFVADVYNNRIQKFNNSGNYLSQFGNSGIGDGQFHQAFRLRIDSFGNIFVLDLSNHRIQKFDNAGIYKSQFGSYGTGNGQFAYPQDLAIDSFGNIFVADKGNYRIQKWAELKRIINLSNTLAFGNVNVGSTKQLSFTISNTGNSPLTVSSITYPTGFSGNWNSGTIAAGSSQNVTVTFAPISAQAYNGTVTVNSDNTSGMNTIGISGTGGMASICDTVTEIPKTECQSLLDLYNNTNGSGWTTKTGWNITNTPCSWYGIGCSGGHVNSLSLYNNQLSGSIPNFNLPNLIYLILYNNQLSGSIPNFDLPNLTGLYLFDNQLSGSIPNFNLPNLTYLHLYDNQLSGNIPNFNLSKLTNIRLENNQLSGNIPNLNLPNLISLHLYNNQLSGTIPNFDMLKLTDLNLSSNQLSGVIPNLNFTSFSYLNLNNNCGLIAYDTAQASVLNTKDPNWQVLNFVCPTRLINLTGSLAFGNVTVNSTKQLTLTISNTGNSSLTVSSITYPPGFSGNWNSGTIAAGSSQTVTVIFVPTAIQDYSGVITVNSDKTSGTNTIAISGKGITTYTISGYVRNSSNNPGIGVTLTFSNSGGTVITDSSGFYTKTVSSDWIGTVTLSKGSYTFIPSSRSYSNITSDMPDQNYTYVASNKAIIVAGGGNYSANDIWNDIEMNTKNAHTALSVQGYAPENIYYLSAASNWTSPVRNFASKKNLQDAIESWASDADNLLIYMISHGGAGTFSMNESETLYAWELDGWLDNIQQTIPGHVMLIYDACQSGSFIGYLIPPTGKKRIIVTSASATESAIIEQEGILVFSSFFWQQINAGRPFYDSFINARNTIELLRELPIPITQQHPQIDADGNGKGNEDADIEIAINTKLTRDGYGFPDIGSVSPNQTLTDTTSALIYAENVTDADGIKRVWAAVIRAEAVSCYSADTPITYLPIIELKPVGNNRYEATYTGFTSKGIYKFAVFATDNRGFTSLLEQKHVTYVTQTQDFSAFARKGDLNGDSQTNLADVISALQVLSGLKPSQSRCDYAASGADVNGDNRVGLQEVIYILQTVAGLR